jgi:hypothetical protein
MSQGLIFYGILMHQHQKTCGGLPSEYDIREVDEELYLAVLEARKQSDAPGSSH